MVLNKNELLNINGGGFHYGILIGIGALLTFIVGIIDGYFRPLACNK